MQEMLYSKKSPITLTGLTMATVFQFPRCPQQGKSWYASFSELFCASCVNSHLSKRMIFTTQRPRGMQGGAPINMHSLL